MYPFVLQHVLDILFQSKCLYISEKEENIFWFIFLDKQEDAYWIFCNKSVLGDCCFNAKWAIFQLCHDEEQVIFDEMMSTLYKEN